MPLLHLILYLILPWLCVAAIPRRLGPGSSAERFIYGVALYEVVLLVVGLGLGLSRQLTAGKNALVSAIVTAVLAALAVRNARARTAAVRGAPPARALRWLRTRRGTAAALLAAGVGVLVAIQLAADALAGTRHWDGLSYHIPRIVFWMQQGSFDAWPTPTWQQIGLPVGADVVLGAKMLLGLGWAGTGYVTALVTAGAIVSVYVAGLELGIERWRAVMAALLFASFPVVGERIASFNSDMVAAFPVLAAAVASRRLRQPAAALGTFLLLLAVGVACKPTVAPLAGLLGLAALWSTWRRFWNPRSAAAAVAASVAGASLIAASYWPVFRAFGDLAGGEFGRACQVTAVPEFLRGALVSLAHWVLEPLGYLPGRFGGWGEPFSNGVYRALGLQLDHGILGTQSLPDWRPMPGSDVGQSGLVPILLFPVMAATLPTRSTRRLVLLWWAGFAAISGLIYSQPWGGRFMVVLLAPYALIWAGTTLCTRRRGRWVLAAMTALNVAAALGVTVILTHMYWGRDSHPGGRFHYIDDAQRSDLAHALSGAPLAVLTEGSLDALLPGPELAFGLRYVLCPADHDWRAELTRAASVSPALVLIHRGEEALRPTPDWTRSGLQRCPVVPVRSLRGELAASGWKLSTSGSAVDVWLRPEAVARVR